MTLLDHRCWRGSVFGSVLLALLHVFGFSGAAQNVLPGAEKIQGILIVPAKAGATNAAAPISNVTGQSVTGVHGVIVRGPEFVQGADFKAMLGKYLGKPLTTGPSG